MKTNRFNFKKSLLSSAILCAIGSTQAAIIPVDGSCTLLEAMDAANNDVPVGTCISGSGDDTIQVVTANSDITISTVFQISAGPGYVGLPIVNSNITIEGNGLTVRADNSTDNFRIFEVGAGGDLTLRDTTVTGVDDGFGASGLFAYNGRVSIDNSTFALNQGGVFIVNGFGNEITNSVIRHNSSNENRAAGLQTYFAGVNISNTSFIENNHASIGSERGGGVGLNIAGGAALFQSEVTITDSTFSGNTSLYGAAITVSSDSPPSLSSKSIFFGQSALRGVIGSELEITNSTITNNRAVIGGGILDLSYYSTNTLQGNIIAGNYVIYDGYGANIFSTGNSTFNLDANNIIGDKGSTGLVNLTLGASDSSFSNYTEDNLYPLTLSQGQLVHPLKEGSIAIDGNDPTCYGSVNDQEGKGRGIDGDENGSFICDVGAFEHSLAIIADGAPCNLVNALESAENDASVGGCQPGNGHDIVVLPENSTQTFDSIVDQIEGNPFYFGIAGISTAITIEGSDSIVERDAGSLEDFDLFYIQAGGQLNLIDATVTGANGALGAVTSWSGGNVNVLNSNISGNQSAGIFDILSINSSVIDTTVNQNTTIGEISSNYGSLTTFQSVGFELRNSTISGNVGGTAGGVDFRAVSLAAMENSTVSGNSAYAIGGLIVTPGYYSQPVLNIRNSTITANSGGYVGGIYAASNAPDTISLSHSIVSGNQYIVPPSPARNQMRNDVFGNGLMLNGGIITPNEIIASAPYLNLDANNIIGQNGDGGIVGTPIGASDIIPVGATDTVIEAALADNGGDTLTHLPIAGGPAVDGGDLNCRLNEDQTGRIRPWDGDNDGNDNCDIGAVELGSIYASDIIFKDDFESTIIVRRKLMKE